MSVSLAIRMNRLIQLIKPPVSNMQRGFVGERLCGGYHNPPIKSATKFQLPIKSGVLSMYENVTSFILLKYYL